MDIIESRLDFTHRIAVHGRDELAQMANAVNRLVAKLQQNLTSIASGSEAVAKAAAEA